MQTSIEERLQPTVLPPPSLPDAWHDTVDEARLSPFWPVLICREIREAAEFLDAAAARHDQRLVDQIVKSIEISLARRMAATVLDCVNPWPMSARQSAALACLRAAR